MRETIKSHRTVAVAGLLGLVAFVAGFRPAFLNDVRPQPRSRDEITAAALEFAALEGWAGPNRVARTYPIEGDDAEAVRAAGGQAPDRETLPDPSWETWLVTDPTSVRRLASGELPDPMISFAQTPLGDVVQYVEVSTNVTGRFPMGGGNRAVPLRELTTDALFEIDAEHRLPPTDEDRANATEIAAAFFARHNIAVEGQPASLHVREGGGKHRVVVMTWERPGPGGTTDLTRVAAGWGRVVAYDRDLRAAQTAPPARTGYDRVMTFVWTSSLVAFVVGSALILVLVVVKRRQGELNLLAAVGLFGFLIALSAVSFFVGLAFTGAMVMGQMGTSIFWTGPIATLVVSPVLLTAVAVVTAAAWAVGESEAYTVWPRNRMAALSDVLRGRLRRREVADQISLGYLLGGAALGVSTVIGLLAPRSSSSSAAAYAAMTGWPIALNPPLQGVGVALQVGLVANVFAMSYVKRLTKRTWAALVAASLLGAMSIFGEVGGYPAGEWTGLAVKLLVTVASAMAFLRFGALASITALFVWMSLQMTAPLLAGAGVHPGHVASGLWAAALTFAPLVAAELAALRPREYAAEGALPAHVRRALDRMRIGEEFEVARRVQAGLLPAGPPRSRGLDVAGVCVPANEVGGDYFDYFELDGGKLAIAVGDVSGKGVPAAIFMTLTKSYMVTQAPRAHEPAVVLARVNAHLKRNLARGTFVTMALAVVDRAAGTLTYTRAGHNPPLLVREDGEGDFLMAQGLALGSAPAAVFEGLTRAETVELRRGDLLLLYTDGVTEAMNARADEYGEDRLVEKVTGLARSGASAQEVVDVLLKDLKAFRGRAQQHDDITIVAVRIQ